MALKHDQFRRELIKMPPMILYKIATDIQVSKKWKDFAYNVGFSTQNVILIEESRGDRFPAENVLNHWYCKNPKLSDLVEVLLKLDLETPLYKIKEANIISHDAWGEIEHRLKMKREAFEVQTDLHLAMPDDGSTSSTKITTKINSSISSTSDINIESVEAGMVDIERNDDSIPRSSFQEVISICSNQESKEYSKSCPFISYILTLLEFRCLKFDSTELELSNVNLKSDRFSTTFNETIRSIKFEIRAFSLNKILKKSKLQIELMNIIWSETSFRFCNLPLLVGYSFVNDFLFLIYKENGSNSLFNLLHRSPIRSSSKLNDDTLSIHDRLLIVKSVGEALSFMHNTIPFGAYHGSVASSNIFVSNHQVFLGNLNQFYTENPNYLKLRELITQPQCDVKSAVEEQSSLVINNLIDKSPPRRSTLQTDVEKRCRKDIKQFIELICEVFWNIQQNKHMHKDDGYDSENDDGNESRQTLSQFVMKHNQRPRIEYFGWSETVNSELCEIIQKAQDKDTSIAEILEDLEGITLKIQKDQISPPPYDYSNSQAFTDKLDQE